MSDKAYLFTGRFCGDYIVEAMALGWFCRNPDCRVFNGDEKQFLLVCRCCGSPRPKREGKGKP
jgi:hypothetical protein